MDMMSERARPLKQQPSRQGASAAEDDLPMVVWLRGDEQLVESFSLSADEAMAVLGIKRSRLTQISGKELRVARMRVDRYVRPLYRPEDVEAYKNWSRAPVTHLRSSSAIEEATVKLAEESTRLEQNLAAVAKTQSELVQNHLNALSEHVSSVAAKSEAEVVQMISQEIRAGHSLQLESEERLLAKWGEQSQQFDQVNQLVTSIRQETSTLSEQKSLLGEISEHLEQLSKLQAETLAEMRSSHEAQLTFNRDLGKALSIVVQFLREAARKQEETIAIVREGLMMEAAQKSRDQGTDVGVDFSDLGSLPAEARRQKAKD